MAKLTPDDKVVKRRTNDKVDELTSAIVELPFQDPCLASHQLQKFSHGHAGRIAMGVHYLWWDKLIIYV